ncbi:serine/threonine protein kinase [Myxococcus xanthus]|uniref:serine/threonine protein kinase n=1 Tax=Myxococcus xanthus TaxID=34 RepID=UPI000345FB3C|nr:serine/threonine-protein kinase [Myxococcus xanthus]QVW70639.1 serine/threonine protein kinase [Myxococcus xanthus DZ2]QZZ49535.1 Serine/threonine-protein kinase PknD [Myxococcus xanthus]UEO03234.1 serine/threonine protein kinase [Myxococcus xanthus DZ2]UYI23970.1 serine/threonine protein kinase [Myxococcus xanthus]SDY27797.1 Serine/threonine protein kinase [Myxococcus xanthus]
MRDNGPPAVLSPGDVVKGYTVVRQLDQGGFGTVYLATSDGQPCALKLVERQRVEGRVEKEVSILLRLTHPNVVGIRGFTYWHAEERDFALIAMEYVEGRKLSAWVKDENPCARRIAKVTLDMARALEASHEAGVVHRDVKDANVMVRDADGLAVLVDYGIGDYRGAPGVTQSMLPPGTMEYRPPEAWLFLQKKFFGKKAGARYVSAPSDDMWALGTVLYRLLTARLPFDAGSEAEYVQAVIGRTPVPPHHVNRFVPERLGMLCMRLLEKDPAARPDASTVCAALEELLSGAEGEAWDTPLFDAYGPNSATTENEGKVNKLERWAKRPLRQMRRGKALGPELPEVPGEGRPAALPPETPLAPAATRPVEAQLPGLALEPGVGAEAAMEADAAPLAPPVAPFVEVGRRSFLSRLRLGRVLGAGLLAMALAYGAYFSLRTDSPQPQAVTGQEVAPYIEKPQAAPAAAPIGPEATPAAVAPPATLPEVTATVTTTKSDSPTSPPVPAKKATRSVSSALATTALCMTLACSGAQVRPPPDPEDCPDGAVEAMAKLGIRVGETNGATFPIKGDTRVIAVREGNTQIRLLGNWGRLPDDTALSGRLILGDRVYGRLTRVRTSKGSFPVCIEVYDTSFKRGLELEPGKADSGRLRVWSSVQLKAVREFE